METVLLRNTPDPDAKAQDYLVDLCWTDGVRYCVKCGAKSPYVLKTGRLRCSSCGYTFHDFSRRWINSGNLSCGSWLRLIRLFADERTIKAIAGELGISYNTAYKAVSTLRRAILANALDANILLDPKRGPDLSIRAKDKYDSNSTKPGPVFGIIEERGFVFADYLPDFSAETILHFKLNFKIRTIRMGGMVFTGRYRNYSTLVCYPGNEIEGEYFGSEYSPAFFSSESGFWTYARKRITKFHGITKQHFPFYLKELEFRYNHRHQDIMPILAQYACGLVPKLD